jgi:hypothetical protein
MVGTSAIGAPGFRHGAKARRSESTLRMTLRRFAIFCLARELSQKQIMTRKDGIMMNVVKQIIGEAGLT